MTEYDNARVEKATRALGSVHMRDGLLPRLDEYARAVLDAVTADIKAEALRELADSIDPTGYGWTDVQSAERFRQRLRERADGIEAES